MIEINGKIIEQNHFPDGTLLLKEDGILYSSKAHAIDWYFESNEELVTLIFLTKHLKNYSPHSSITLYMYYVPNARQDRVKTSKDVFTLKYFAETINSLYFDKVYILDPHSLVSVALIDRVVTLGVQCFINDAIANCVPDMLFFPDEGAMKRYSSMTDKEYAFGIKKRDWATGQILGLDVAGCVDKIKDSTILIVDDICSKGGTFYHSAKKLKELGAKEIYLYITHCENTILEGELLESGLINKVYTTNSIFTKEHDLIEVFEV